MRRKTYPSWDRETSSDGGHEGKDDDDNEEEERIARMKTMNRGASGLWQWGVLLYSQGLKAGPSQLIPRKRKGIQRNF